MTHPDTVETGEVLVSRHGRVLVLTLNRPEVKNAMNARMAQSIATALDMLDNDPQLSAGIIAARGEVFCSGMDLKAFLRGERPVVEGRGFAGFVQTPPVKPLIAAVQGPALAGGCEIVLACDLVVASQNASFGLPEARRGLVAVGGGLLRLPQRIPHQLAMEMALTGGQIDGQRAYNVGLVNRIVPSSSQVLTIAMELAGEVSASAPQSLQASKRIINESSGWPALEVWTRQRDIALPVMESADAKEGARAFAEKRAPQWRGL